MSSSAPATITKDFVSPTQVENFAYLVAKRILAGRVISKNGIEFQLYGVPRGGVPAAFAVSDALNRISFSSMGLRCAMVVDNLNEANIIVDDLIDSGTTEARYRGPGKEFYALVDKRHSLTHSHWFIFPWEQGEQHNDESVTDNVLRILQYIGEDTTREGLKETPKRVVKAWAEWFSGYGQDPGKLFKSFMDGAPTSQGDEMVVVHNIPVYSKCEHHMADIFGHAHIAYIPDKRILGLSKFARVVECFMRRLQVQERLTHQIADAFMEHLQPQAVGVIIKARHMCMESRGVRAPGTITTTSAIRGIFRNNAAAKAEFVSLVESAEKSR